MILVDTSIWIDHIRRPDLLLSRGLAENKVLIHPFVLGELALGQFARREAIIDDLSSLPTAQVATNEEVLGLVERAHLHGSGVGYVDAHLLTSALLTDTTQLWTRDRRLAAAAERLGMSFSE